MKNRKPEGASMRLEGMLIAAATPRRAQEHTIDLGAMLELIDFLGEARPAGIVLLGSTGDFVHFALDDRRHMVSLAAKRSRVPLLVNVSHSTLDGAVHLAREALGAGVAGLLVMPPYYFRYGQDEIRSFFLAFAAAIGNAAPLYLYNIPAFTSDIASSTAIELMAGGPYAGIKDSSGSLDNLRALCGQAAHTPFTIYAGMEQIYVQSRQMGAQGAISGVATALPELMVSLDHAITAREGERITRLEARLREFLEKVAPFPWPAGVKEALKQRKLKSGELASPLGIENQRKLVEFGGWFRDWLPQVLRECDH